MKKKLVSFKEDHYKLLAAATIFTLILSGFLSYSTHKFSAISKQPAIKSNVAMQAIHHNVKSVCPKCGFKGIPLCPQCSVEMYWNGYRGSFICPSCGNEGFPQCRHCGEFMSWVEAK